MQGGGLRQYIEKMPKNGERKSLYNFGRALLISLSDQRGRWRIIASIFLVE